MMNDVHADHKFPRLGTTGLAMMLMLFAAPMVRADAIVVSSPFAGSSGDFLFRGFYVSSYAGDNLSTVTLGYTATVAGAYTTSLTARLGAYDGAIIGSTQTLISNLGPVQTLVTYDFGGALVPTGSLVTFTQQFVSGPSASLFYDAGTGGAATGLIQTQDTSAPLSTFRRDNIGVIITQQVVPEPSTILLLGTAVAGLVAFRRRRP